MKVLDTILCEMDDRENKIARITDLVVSTDTLEGIKAMADLLFVHKQLLATSAVTLAQNQAQLALAEAKLQAMIRPFPHAI